MTTRQPLFPRRQTHPVADEHAVLNWAQNATLAQERAVITPETEAQLQQAIASCQGRYASWAVACLRAGCSR
jgi:hypothetical protein